jgi:hypothetical protein
MYISPSVFIALNKNKKQTSEWSYESRNTRRPERSRSVACVVTAIKDIRETVVS